MKTLSILGALPLVIYPFVALASVMSLAGEDRGNAPLLLVIVARTFQVSSLLYPVVYFGSRKAARQVMEYDEAKAIKIASIPLWYLGFVVLSLVAWTSFGT